ncbi:MAG: hypothetical protein ACTSVY_02995 [Candidatus Helarchaeota archaeon]
MFKEINKKKMSHSALKKKLNLPGPEITRHIKRLKNFKLIQKNLDGSYEATNFGRLIFNSLDYFEFNVKFIDFINSHDVEAIPSNLIPSLGMLKNCQILTKTMENIEIWSQMITEAKKIIYAITEQLRFSILPIIQQKLKHQNLEIKTILEKSLLDYFIEKDEWEKNVPGEIPEVVDFFHEKIGIPKNIRKMEDLKLSLIITEKKMILFLSSDRGIDYSECLYAENNPKIKEWAKNLFDYYWNQSEIVTMEELMPNS